MWTEQIHANTEEWTSYAKSTEYTVTLFDCNRLAQVIILWQMQKFMCYCTVFALFYFKFEGNFRLQAGAFIWRGDLSEGFLRY